MTASPRVCISFETYLEPIFFASLYVICAAKASGPLASDVFFFSTCHAATEQNLFVLTSTTGCLPLFSKSTHDVQEQLESIQ